MNEQIRTSPVRVVGPRGEVLGILATAEALKLAVEAGLDLVEVAPNVRPPICKIMDSGKFAARQIDPRIFGQDRW